MVTNFFIVTDVPPDGLAYDSISFAEELEHITLLLCFSTSRILSISLLMPVPFIKGTCISVFRIVTHIEKNCTGGKRRSKFLRARRVKVVISYKMKVQIKGGFDTRKFFFVSCATHTKREKTLMQASLALNAIDSHKRRNSGRPLTFKIGLHLIP